MDNGHEQKNEEQRGWLRSSIWGTRGAWYALLVIVVTGVMIAIVGPPENQKVLTPDIVLKNQGMGSDSLKQSESADSLAQNH